MEKCISLGRLRKYQSMLVRQKGLCNRLLSSFVVTPIKIMYNVQQFYRQVTFHDIDSVENLLSNRFSESSRALNLHFTKMI